MELIWRGLLDAASLIIHTDRDLMRIAGLSLLVSGTATLIASVLGIPAGVLLHLAHFRGQHAANVVVNAGMGVPPVLVGLLLTLLLWRTGPLGALRLLYTPWAMILAQVLVASPLIAGFTRTALSLVDPDIILALRVDGAAPERIAREVVLSVLPQVLVAVAAGFGRAISEVGASLMVGGNIVGQTRLLTTAIALESGKGDFALALALGLILLTLALLVNALLGAATGLTRPALR